MKKFKYGAYDEDTGILRVSNTKEYRKFYDNFLENVEVEIVSTIMTITADELVFKLHYPSLKNFVNINDVEDEYKTSHKKMFSNKIKMVLKEGNVLLKKRKLFILKTNIIKIKEET
jgi:hypothetical protein